MIPYHDYEGAEYEYPPHEEEPMTNEAWLKSLSTEELANYIATQCADAIRLWREMQYWTAHEKCKSNKWYVWLKEVHNADRS